MKRLLMLMVTLSVAFTALPAGCAPAAPIEEEPSRSKSLDIMADDIGISFGNSKRVRGLRFNVRDEGVEEVVGLNLTLWKPGENPDAVMKGLLFGIYGPAADELHFISIGIASVEAYSLISGIAIGGGTVVSEGFLNGIALSGLANVAEGGMTGVSAGGLALVADGPISGLTAGGLIVFTTESIAGITASFGAVAGSEIAGLTVGGIGAVSIDNVRDRRISYTGISAKSARWITVHGIEIAVEQNLEGFAASGIRIDAERIMGAAAALVVSSGEMHGLGIGGVNYSSDLQVGLSIGIVNYTEHLNGIQLGLVNIARNNSKPFQILPILNAHFD